MFIDLSWTDLNAIGTKLEIYRGDAPLDRQNLPGSPIVTLSAGETSYRDETNVVLGKTYYYVFVSSTASDRVVSQNYEVRAVTRRGPGPQTLKQGDNALGYFGALTSGEFLSSSELTDLSGLRNFATALVAINPFPLWHKFVRNNKILIVPEGPIGYNVTWAQLYAAGMVYGTDDNGAVAYSTATKQSAKITIGKDVFRLRLIRGMSDGPYTTAQSVYSPINEWNDLVYPMAHPVPSEQRLENLYLNGRSTFDITAASYSASGYVLVQEPVNSGSCNVRGQVASVDDTVTDTSAYISARGNVGFTVTGYYWLPVLELIEG